MYRTGESYKYEARSMVQFILEGHNKEETAEEFEVSCGTVARRIKSLGYTYEAIAELRDKRHPKKYKSK